MPINCSTQASTSNSPSDRNNSESRLNLCQSLLKRRLELAKADPNSKDPAIISTRKDVSAQLSSLICEPGGVEILFLAIDQTSDPSFWNTTIACYSLSTIILSVPQKNVFTVMTEIRKLIQNEAWGNKLSLLLASLIEISERIPTAKVASAADVVFVDFILRPFQRLWEGNWKFLMQTDTNGHWNQLLDSSIWTAHCWLKHSNKMKRLKVHSRLDKFFSVCMVMNGHLGALEEKQQTVLSGLKQAFVEIIAGIVGSNSDVNQEKNAEYFVKNFIEISESSLPFFDFSVASKQLIEVVDEKKISSAKKLIFKQVNLSILPLNEATANLDAYINSLIEFAETLNSKDKARLLINLWSECVQNWTTYKQDMQWSTSESKWSSICGKSNTAAQNVEKRRFIVEYFMSALETLLDNIADDLDQTSTLKLVELSKNLISTSINELSDEFARVSGLDLNTWP
ncbi:hypothetical protein M3Y97_00397900 [Aphelenchoides bicaudatus]|nr:hypothetical protein M3Y97_00397900 [Aphelenchoides bicaudatus]